MMCYITVVGGEAEGRYVKLDGAKVRWHRDQLGWTLDDLAEQAEVAKGTVLRAEHGEDVRPSSGRRIARAFGIEIPELSPEKPGMALAGKAEAPATGPSRKGREQKNASLLLPDPVEPDESERRSSRFAEAIFATADKSVGAMTAPGTDPGTAAGMVDALLTLHESVVAPMNDDQSLQALTHEEGEEILAVARRLIEAATAGVQRLEEGAEDADQEEEASRRREQIRELTHRISA